MRCVDCGFYEYIGHCGSYCRYLDEVLTFDAMDEVPREFTACPYNVTELVEEPEYVQRARKALENDKQKSLFEEMKNERNNTTGI